MSVGKISNFILEIPKKYIYGEYKENLFQTVKPMEVVSGGSRATTYTNCIPNHFIKSAVIVERGLENEYLVIDNLKSINYGVSILD